jgi:hypothetical protein
MRLTGPSLLKQLNIRDRSNYPATSDQEFMIDLGLRYTLMTQVSFQIRALLDGDPVVIADAFQRIGWKKTEAQYQRYLEEQAAGQRACWVAFVGRRFAGCVTLNWQPTYAPFA